MTKLGHRWRIRGAESLNRGALCYRRGSNHVFEMEAFHPRLPFRRGRASENSRSCFENQRGTRTVPTCTRNLIKIPFHYSSVHMHLIRPCQSVSRLIRCLISLKSAAGRSYRGSAVSRRHVQAKGRKSPHSKFMHPTHTARHCDRS